MCRQTCAANSGHAVLDSSGVGGLGREIWPHPPAVAAVGRCSAPPEEHVAGAAHPTSHLQSVQCFLLHPR